MSSITPNENKVIKINNLTKNFRRLTAVNDLSLEVGKGYVYGILGPNGSGKSTTLGMILNVINPSSGNWSWFGGIDSVKAMQKVGAIIEQPNFYPYHSAYKNLKIVAAIKGISDEKIDEKLEIVGLLDRKNDKFRTYSLGMKQRLAIASALLNDPEVLILDEPTNGLDPAGIIQVRNIIKKIAENGTTILLASHLLDEVEKICSHVIILQNGQTLYSGLVDEMSASNGFYELKSKNNPQLIEVLKKSGHFGKIHEEDGQVKAFIEKAIEPDDLNRFLFENGVVLSYLFMRKESLENQFLSLTEKPN